MAEKKKNPYSTPTSQESLLAHAKAYTAFQARNKATQATEDQQARIGDSLSSPLQGRRHLIDALTQKKKKKKQ